VTLELTSAAIEIIPVLDLMHGQVVRGIAGHRESYRPVSSRLVDSADPITIADTFATRLGLKRIYLADLDAITGQQPDWNTIKALADAGYPLLVDAGLQDAARARKLLELRVDSVVAGLETLGGPDLLEELVEAVGDKQLIFSLDMQAGRPMTDAGAWPDPTPWGIAETAIDAGIRRIIVLDLAGVGSEGGLPTLELCRRIRSRHAEIELITGGGIRNRQDILAAADAGVDAVLVASALHDGSLG
jgi:phosphoribosylformimino-5-aminoimidazole carboxamide ribotide isomerase